MVIKKNVNADAALELLTGHYGLKGELSSLPGENINFLVRCADKKRFVLKIYPNVRSEAELELEDAAARHAIASGLPLSVPQVIPTVDGKPSCQQSLLDGSVGRARLLSFVEGVPWCDRDETSRALREDLGSLLAKMHQAFESFSHAAADRTHQWDLRTAGRHRFSVPFIDGSKRREIVEWMLHFWAACAAPRLSECPTSFIHGDVNDENVFTDGDRVVGLIDFGDCLIAPKICDLAIAVAYLVLDEDEPLLAASDIVRGYESVRPLQSVEQEVLFPLVCGRLATSVTIAAARRREDPNRASWFVTEERAWRALQRFYDVEPSAAKETLCGPRSAASDTARDRPLEDLLESRARHIGSNLSIAYRKSIKMARGRGQYLYGADGRPFLDLVNNVCHVGHCHPRVVEAGQRQMALLNTNSRYVYEGLTDYAERLCATLPDPLNVCYLVNSGTEANELAVRLARLHTGRFDMVVVDGAYHGHSDSMIAMSPYKFLGPGGSGESAPWVHVTPLPDGYRGRHRGHSGEVGIAYGDEVGRVLGESSDPIAGFITESLPSCGGQIIPPDGYLETAFRHVRGAGGVCMIDEVQAGFGRVGTHFWGFELQGVTPDIVVMGKPIGNGHPMAAVVTTPDIASSFANGMEYFSTFGGNPVSCAIGLAVLDVIKEEGLQEHARIVGHQLLEGLKDLSKKHAVIGDVRGRGLFIGIELVRDRASLEPADREADELVNAMRHRGILLSVDGPLRNVIKIKPPMVLTEDDADMVIRCLDDVLDDV